MDTSFIKMKQAVKIFLRLSIAASFLSAVADRWGMWGVEQSAWGNWDSFVEYTHVVNPWFAVSAIPFLAILATAAEVVFAICLILGLQTRIVAFLSGVLLLIFALSMSFSIGIKAPLDFSVFTASAAAFALSLIKEKYLEVDMLFSKSEKIKA